MNPKPETLERLRSASLIYRQGNTPGNNEIFVSAVWAVAIELGICDRELRQTTDSREVEFRIKWTETLNYLDREYPEWRGYPVEFQQTKSKYRKAK